MGLFDKIKNNAIDIVTSSVTGNPYGITCAYACPETDWNPTPPWESIPCVPPTPESEQKKEIDGQKNVDYYKKEFARLFKEMEEQLGKCKRVEISKGDKICVSGGSEWSEVIIEIEF